LAIEVIGSEPQADFIWHERRCFGLDFQGKEGGDSKDTPRIYTDFVAWMAVEGVTRTIDDFVIVYDDTTTGEDLIVSTVMEFKHQ
jgi:hypothetical protein